MKLLLDAIYKGKHIQLTDDEFILVGSPNGWDDDKELLADLKSVFPYPDVHIHEDGEKLAYYILYKDKNAKIINLPEYEWQDGLTKREYITKRWSETGSTNYVDGDGKPMTIDEIFPPEIYAHATRCVGKEYEDDDSDDEEEE